jgi:hypothetical protein
MRSPLKTPAKIPTSSWSSGPIAPGVMDVLVATPCFRAHSWISLRLAYYESNRFERNRVRTAKPLGVNATNTKRWISSR